MSANVIGNSDGGGHEYARSKNRGNGFWNQFLRGFNLDNALEERERRIHSRWLEATVKAVTADILSQSHGLQEDIVQKVVRIVMVRLELAENDPSAQDLLEQGTNFSIDYGEGGILSTETGYIANACEKEFDISIPNRDLEDGDFKPILRTVGDLIGYIQGRLASNSSTVPSLQ